VGDTSQVLHWDGSSWSSTDPDLFPLATDVWGTAEDDIWVAGGDNSYTYSVLWHWDGRVWSPEWDGGLVRHIWGTSPDDVWAVGFDGLILHFDGTDWSEVASGTSENLFSVWGYAPDDVWAVGGATTTLHWDGQSWTDLSMVGGGGWILGGVWGSAPDDVWAVGWSIAAPVGVIFHWDGDAWTIAEFEGHLGPLNAVAGMSGDDVLAVASDMAVRWDGSTWSKLDSAKGLSNIFDVCADGDSLWLAGGGMMGSSSTTILRYRP
jgi:hypothetical protein